MKCPYCEHEAKFEPGVMMIEAVGDLAAILVHEECYQQSGDDEGYVERLHRTLDDEDHKDFFSINR